MERKNSGSFRTNSGRLTMSNQEIWIVTSFCRDRFALGLHKSRGLGIASSLFGR